MHRRQVLRRAGIAVTTLAVAGCSGQDGATDPADGGDDEATDEGTETSTDDGPATDTGTADGPATDTGTDGRRDDRRPTDRIDVVSKVGLVADGRISAVELVVAPAAGAGRVDLEALTIQWVDENGTYEVAAAASEATVDGSFRITPIKDSDDSTPVMNAADDRMQLSMALEPTDEVAGVDVFGEPLEPGSDATLRVATGSDTTATVRLTVPETLADERAVTL